MLNKDFEYRGFCKNQKDFWDLYSVMETAENKGREEGRAEIAIEIAKNLLATGMPVDVIAQGTGLSIEEISQL